MKQAQSSDGTFRRLLMLLVCVSLVAAACGAEDDDPAAEPDEATATSTGAPDVSDEAPPATTDTTDGPLPASAPGVTEDTITVGVPITDVTQFANIGDLTETYEVLADLTNEAGGVGGRMIEVFAQRWSILDTEAYDAACIALTEDIQSFIIVGFLLAGFGGTDCYTDRHETLVINTEGISADNIANADGRLMTTEVSNTGLAIDGVPLLADDLRGANVVVYAGSDQPSLMARAVEELEAVGAIVVEEAVQNIGASEDLLAAEAELDVAVQRWIAADAEWVFNLDGSIAGSLAALQRVGRNDIGVVHAGTEVATLRALGADPALAETLLGVGVVAADFLYQDGLYGTVECVDKVSERLDVTMEPFVPEGELDQLAVTVRACAAWDTFVTIAEAAGRDLTTESFLQAGYDLGDFDLTGAPSGALRPDKPFVGNGEPAVFLYDAASDEFLPR